MATEVRKRNSQSTSAEISLVHLKNCLVNLPSSLASLLVNINTVSLSSPLAPAEAYFSLACAKCHYRIELPCPSTCWERVEGPNSEIHLCWMDWYAEQATACAYCQ